MADGASLCGGFNTNSFTSRVKKTNSTNVRRSSRQTNKKDANSRVVLEKVLGITTSSSSGLACDPNTGTVAYPAGCVIVLLNPKTNEQSHILNTSRKTFSALAFSQNGKYLVTGESGHMPCVRVWDVADHSQVAEVQCHKYGVACVAFSTNGTYIVSVGYQHDRTVSVWEWKRGTVIASNKVSSRVLAVSFSEDSSYFVTAGNRHVKFWYLDASRERRVNSTVPLIGRSGLLGEHHDSEFCDLACGRGAVSSSTYCITRTGLLCQFNSNRQLDLWVDLKTSSACCLSVSDTAVFCGCADGMVRVFSPQNLHYITTLNKPHFLGVDVSQGKWTRHQFTNPPEYPDTLALTLDSVTGHLTCVYNDHSVYVWDVRDVSNVAKIYSSLYHSACVWSVETYPELEDSTAVLLPGSFFTCSSDNTIRLWKSDSPQRQSQSTDLHLDTYSQDLVKIVYVDEDTQHLKSLPEKAESNQDAKCGIRVLGISPDGQYLAAGDRSGNLRIVGLQFMDELLKIEAHDSEILCVAFSPSETGLHLLASAGRDRLIHIFNMENNYNLVQTVYDHSASVTAMKFTGVGQKVCMVSCGADKSIYFRSAEKLQSSQSLAFSMSHHVVEKGTLYDMDLDSTLTHTAIACQDRNIRIYNVKSGKMKKYFKGSLTDDGTLVKVQLDPSGMYLATSCSDKSICIFDYENGQCVATLFGHSEIVTGMKFSTDCRHLITVCGDSCVFIWRLCSQMTNAMRKRLAERKRRTGLKNSNRPACKQQSIRRETYIAEPRRDLVQPWGEANRLVENQGSAEEDPRTPARLDTSTESLDFMVLQTNGRLPMWARRLHAGVGNAGIVEPQFQPQSRWDADPSTIRSLLEAQNLQPLISDTPCRADNDFEDEVHEDLEFHPQSLDSLLSGEEEEEGDNTNEEEEVEGGSEQFSSVLQDRDVHSLEDDKHFSSSENNDYILYPANSTALSSTVDGDFVKELCEDVESDQEDELSPDSACSAESDQVHSDQAHDQDTDSLSQVSSNGSSGVEEEEVEAPATLLCKHFETLAEETTEKFNTDLRSLQPTKESNFLNPRLSLSSRFLSRFQNRIRGTVSGSGPVNRSKVHLPSIPDESCNNTINIQVTEESTVLNSKTCVPNDRGNDQHKQITAQEQNTSDVLVKTKDSSTFIKVDSADLRLSGSCTQSDINTNANTSCSSREGNLGVCPQSDHKSEKLGKPSLPNQELTLESQEKLPQQEMHIPTPSKPNPQQQPLLGARANLHLNLSTSCSVSLPSSALKALRSQVEHMDPLCKRALVSPTEMKSLGKESRKRINSIEATLTPKSSQRRASVPQRVKESPLVSSKKSLGSKLPKTPVSQPMVERPTAADLDETMDLQSCEEMVNLLQHTMQKAVSCYSKLQAVRELSEQQVQMRSLMHEAFSEILQELHALCPEHLNCAVPQTQQPPEDSPGRQLRDERAMALLERYSEMLLVRMAEKNTDCT